MPDSIAGPAGVFDSPARGKNGFEAQEIGC